MGHFNAFKGSRAAIDNGKILIVRSMSADSVTIDEMEQKLNESINLINGRDIRIGSEESAEIINKMDEQIRSTISIQGDTDSNGILRLTKDLEAQGVAVKFNLIELEYNSLFVVCWRENKGTGHYFVEITISNNL